MFPFTFPTQSSNRKYNKCLPTFFLSWFFCSSQNYLISFCQNLYLFYSAYYFLTKLHLIVRVFKDPLIFLLLSVCPPFCPFALTQFKSNSLCTVPGILQFHPIPKTGQSQQNLKTQFLPTVFKDTQGFLSFKMFYCINMGVKLRAGKAYEYKIYIFIKLFLSQRNFYKMLTI